VKKKETPLRVPRQSRQVTFGPDKREKDDVLFAFGKKLRPLRVAAGLSQQDLAVRCFTRFDRISAYERGVRAPDLIALLLMGETLGVSAGDLTDGLVAPLRRTGTAQLLELVSRQSGLSTDAAATSLGVPFWYASTLARYLQSTGAIVSAPTGWQPVDQQTPSRATRQRRA
jgi:transcriptional regulator with XRE-family HTH domain